MDSLNGILFKDWIKLLKTNHFKISMNKLPKIIGLTILSINNSGDYKREQKYYPEILKTDLVRDPVFLLGHWRSGTTFLHNVLSRDPQFAYANIFEIRNPHTFIVRQNIFERRKRQEGSEARPTDNIMIDFTSPGEEEFGVAILSKMSPLFGWAFPNSEDYYEKFSTFLTASDEERQTWKRSFHFYMQKLTYLYKKQLMLKSPLNTGRIKLLLDLYPNAKFINIHRNPYTVFQSTLKMYETAVVFSAFHKRDLSRAPDHILQHYSEMYDAFFTQKGEIPAGNYMDIAFENLEKDPAAVVKHIYSSLQIPGHSEAEREIATYIGTLKGYQKNKYPPLEQNLKERIFREWKRNFDAWGYTK